MAHTYAASVLILVISCSGSAKQQPNEPVRPEAPVASSDRATVPLHVEGNRPFVDLTFRRADGTTRTARFLVDSGGGGFLIVEPLAKELGLTLAETETEEGETFAPVTSSVQVSIGSVALTLDPSRVLVLVGKTNMLPPAAPGHADGMLPGHVLAQYHVIFDYPKGTFTIAKPGVLRSDGKPMAMSVAEKSGFPRTELEVDGKTQGMLLDTGASFTMVSQALLESWGKVHVDWKRHPGAFGEAATLGGQTLETMFIANGTWGGQPLVDFGVVSQKTGVFEQWMSSMMTAPIVGSLAGNVLKQFRVDLDYPNQQLYVSNPAPSRPPDPLQCGAARCTEGQYCCDAKRGVCLPTGEVCIDHD
jgi:predicted aspartyl protease